MIIKLLVKFTSISPPHFNHPELIYFSHLGMNIHPGGSEVVCHVGIVAAVSLYVVRHLALT